jgi:hypothetical protein
MTGMEIIRESLQKLLEEKEIIARCELLLRTYEYVRKASLCDAEQEELKTIAGKHFAPGIFASMISGSPIFFNLPKLDTYTQINGHIFHFLHTKKFSKQDFDNAYRKFQNERYDLRMILLQGLKDLLEEFMKDAGYRLQKDNSEQLINRDQLIFEAADRKLKASIFSSVKALDSCKCLQEMEKDLVILLPSGEDLEPFMKFFREKGQAIEESGGQVWVANMEKGTIDPFIGYATDMEIYQQFKNPRLAEMVRTNWKPR